MPEPVLEELKSLLPSNRSITISGVVLTRKPRRRRRAAPFLKDSEAPWRYTLALLENGLTVKEEWTKIHGVGAVVFPEGTYHHFRPAWVIHLFASEGTAKPVTTEVAMEEETGASASKPAEPEVAPALPGEDEGPINLGKLNRYLGSQSRPVISRGRCTSLLRTRRCAG